VTPLLVAFSVEDPTVRSEDGGIVLCIDGEEHRLSRAAARTVADDIGDAMTERREFVHTAGEHREDGSYVVSRRGADSTGNRKVFDAFDRAERHYQRLPPRVTAEEVGRTGITGSRRHMLLRHFAEHPAFDCEVVKRNPLTVEKRGQPDVPTEVAAGD
jgi:hypothetical protein